MFRWLALGTLIACLGISTYYRRRARRESGTIPRRREGIPFVAARLMVALPLLAAILLHVTRPAWMAWASFGLPQWGRWAGVGLGLLTPAMAYWVFVSLGRNVSETIFTKPEHSLVMTGPYRWIRHPLYTTGLALLLAIGLMLASWLVLLFMSVALVSIRWIVIPREEAQLVARFGDDYQAYRRGTGQLLPRLRGERSRA